MPTKVRNSSELQSAIDHLNSGAGQKHLILDQGDYFFERPLEINSNCSGLVIEGAGKVNLFGGVRITRWQKKNDFLWSAKLPQTSNVPLDFRMLIVNGRYADRARLPEKGFFIHETEFDVTWKSTYEGGFERQPTPKELTTLKYKPEDIPKTLEPKNAELTIFHMWDESLVGVKRIDGTARTITFSNPSGWPPGAFTKAYNFEKRYILWNTIEGMTKPGQWFLDRRHGEIVYWPLENERMQEATIIAPCLESLIIVGHSDEDIVTDIQIKNMSISATNAPLMSGAFGAKLFDGAVSLRNVEGATLQNLNIFNVGAHCIKASGDHISIRSCHLHNAGAGAIRLVGSHALIHNNHIHDIGKTFPSAIAMYVGATDPNVPEEWEAGKLYTDCKITHNELHDVPYAAICAGGKNLRIEKNLVHRAMQNLYDGAGIYITFCTNALVKQNFIRDIKDTPGAGTSAYYLDEKAIDCTIEENVEINVPRPSHNHIAFNNTFRNNIFIMKGKGWFSLERSKGYHFEKNVMVATEGLEFYDMVAVERLENNILCPGQGQLITKELDHYDVRSAYELKLENGNTTDDPLLLNYENGKIQFANDSIAHKLGIQEVDVSDAGLIKE
ncbi:hypothetical protein FGF1_09940 [Flavobacteriaceae bacterium GF1]